MSFLQVYRTATISQYRAAIATLMQCVDLCPDAMWEKPVAKNSFSESAFHALLFGDLYLGKDSDALREQPFHKDHPEIFRDYEELEDRAPQLLYSRSMLKDYSQFVEQKVVDVMNAETETSLAEAVGFEWLDITRAEMHPYNIRHIQHHAAQLILKLRLNTDVDPKWFRYEH